MQVIYAQTEYDVSQVPSIFLAGPTPRTQGIHHWREDAIQIFEDLEFDGAIFIPTTKVGVTKGDPYEQTRWEWVALEKADVIMFWIPRDLETLPGFTTNIEWGMYFKSGKVVLGIPPVTPKTGYIHHCAMANDVPIAFQLRPTITDAIKLCSEKTKCTMNPRCWIPCSGGLDSVCPCGQFWCNIHGQHVHICECPLIEDWTCDPYTTRLMEWQKKNMAKEDL